MVRHPGHLVEHIKGMEKPYWGEQVRTTVLLEKGLMAKAKELFPGQVSMLVNNFLKEVIKGKPRIIFDMQFPRDPRVEETNPFMRPSLIVQCEKNGRPIAKYETAFQAFMATGISSYNIHNAVEGKTKQAGGFRWVYEEKATGWDQLPELSVTESTSSDQ